jgi:hypothetical protein
VEITVLVNALEAVRAEEVALTLNDIGRTLRLRKAVEVAQCRTKCRKRQTRKCCLCNDLAKTLRCLAHTFNKGRNQQEVLDFLAFKSLRNIVEEQRTNDAAFAPNAGGSCKRDVPAMFLGRCGQNCKTLCIGNDLASQQTLLKVSKELRLISNIKRAWCRLIGLFSGSRIISTIALPVSGSVAFRTFAVISMR